jgi:hypothetical protein
MFPDPVGVGVMFQRHVSVMRRQLKKPPTEGGGMSVNRASTRQVFFGLATAGTTNRGVYPIR